MHTMRTLHKKTPRPPRPRPQEPTQIPEASKPPTASRTSPALSGPAPSGIRPRTPRAARIALPAAALAAAGLLTLTACGGSDGGNSGKANGGAAVVEQGDNTRHGGAATVLDTPFTKPDLVLTDTHGKKYDLRAETKNHPTLLYFGYTHCPDVCPLTMSNIAVAKKSLPRAEQDKLRVVFVTTDPGRDTPKTLGTWLKAQDPDFIGLTGDFKKVQSAARQLGISVEPTHKEKDGSLVSTHGTQVVAFSPKTNEGYLMYGKDATVDDYTKDLPKIVKGERP